MNDGPQNSMRSSKRNYYNFLCAKNNFYNADSSNIPQLNLFVNRLEFYIALYPASGLPSAAYTHWVGSPHFFTNF